MHASYHLHAEDSTPRPIIVNSGQAPPVELWCWALLGVAPGAPVEECERAYDDLTRRYDPRTAADQRWAINVQNAIGEAMDLIASVARGGG